MSVTSMSRITAVFFFSSDVLVIRVSRTSVPRPFWISLAADIRMPLRLSLRYSACSSSRWCLVAPTPSTGLKSRNLSTTREAGGTVPFCSEYSLMKFQMSLCVRKMVSTFACSNTCICLSCNTADNSLSSALLT